MGLKLNTVLDPKKDSRCHTPQQGLQALRLPTESSVMQRYPPIFILLQQAVSSGCCQIINSLDIPSPDGKDHRVNIP